MKLKRTHTDIIAKAMDVLARDVESHDGVANAAIGEAAQRLRELQSQVNKWEAELGAVMPADFKDWHQNDPLERPAVARWVIENLRRQVADTQVRLDAALAEIAALRRDKERMDWLECEPTGRLAEARRIVWQQRDTSTAVRAAIDAAMKGGAQ